MRRIRPRDDRGASAAEYGLLVAAIAAVIVVILWALGGLVVELFDDTCKAVDSEAQTAETC